MSRCSLFLFALLLFVSCADKREAPPTPAQQAETYYNMLVRGDYEGFVRGTYGADSLPPFYLQQRIDLLAQHVCVERSDRGGYARFRAVDDVLLPDSTHLVYLDVLFNDSTHERICCPLVQHNGRWVMRN